MNFGKALKKMKAGKEVAREVWLNFGEPCHIGIQFPDKDSKITTPFLYWTDNVITTPYIIPHEDLLSEDWIVVEDCDGECEECCCND